MNFCKDKFAMLEQYFYSLIIDETSIKHANRMLDAKMGDHLREIQRELLLSGFSGKSYDLGKQTGR